MSLILYILSTIIVTGLSLECYTGFTYLRGQSVGEIPYSGGTSKEKCTSSLDYCYNMTADVSSLNNLKMAGCSAARCFLSRNKCISQTLQGKQVMFCCCNSGDLCNSKLTNLSFVEKTKQRAKDFLGIFGGGR